jgi:hypothetical protein
MSHSIAFPMNGPVECFKKLPCLDEKYRQQVTFLGPRDEWMKKAGKYSKRAARTTIPTSVLDGT